MLYVKIAAVVAAAAGALALTACDPTTTGTQLPTAVRTPAYVPVEATRTIVPVAPVKADPYSSNGEWLVPSDIAPGQYKATATGSSGYVEVCADLGCKIDMDGSDHTGMIANYSVSGQAYVVVPAYAAKVKLRGIVLTPVG